MIMLGVYLVRKDLIYEGITTRRNQPQGAGTKVRKDLIYEGITTLDSPIGGTYQGT